MIVYDDKTENVHNTGTQLLISSCHSSEDITFKASFIVSSDLSCSGKITALFDLVVYGDIHAEEIDIKGRFVCMGHCTVSGAIVVQNDMWCEDVQAASITCHDRIVAQSIDADNIFADSNIIIGKTLAIEKKAQTNQNVLCGETAYGAGKIIASSILTVEPLDLDDGEEALESPFQYSKMNSSGAVFGLSKESARYAERNDFLGFIAILMENADDILQKRLKRYVRALQVVQDAYPSSITKLRDVSVLIWLIEISQSDYFKGWEIVTKWSSAVLHHFQDIANGNVSELPQGKPAEMLLKGYTVSHKNYGIGVVESITSSGPSSSSGQIAIVNFEKYGRKKFPVPNALKFFVVLSETSEMINESMKSSLTCNIKDYDEWISALNIISESRTRLGDNLYNTVFELLIGKIGLKAKYIDDRFKEKGWD